MRDSRFATIVFGIVVVMLAAREVRADGGASAEELKNRGNQAMLDMNYADALSAYRAAFAANPSDLALLYNIGRAHQAREEYPEALDALEQFAHTAPAGLRAKVPALDKLLEDVGARVGRLSIACSEDVGPATIVVGERTRIEGCGKVARAVRVSLPARTATIDVRLESDRWQADVAHVPIEGGRPVSVLFSVLAKETSGTLRVTTTPPLSNVAIDGVVRGNAPLELPMPAGAHVVDVQAEGHEPAHIPVVVEAGRARDLALTLEPKTPITKRWWFWGAVSAVVVVGAAAITYVVVAPERDPTPGSIPPGTIKAPLVSF